MELQHDFPRALFLLLPVEWRGTSPGMGSMRAGGFYSGWRMNGRRRTAPQAGADQQPHPRGIAWVVGIRAWLARAFSGRNRQPDSPRADVGRLIARRAERVSNRKREAADRYIAIHEILRGGK